MLNLSKSRLHICGIWNRVFAFYYPFIMSTLYDIDLLWFETVCLFVLVSHCIPFYSFLFFYFIVFRKWNFKPPSRLSKLSVIFRCNSNNCRQSNSKSRYTLVFIFYPMNFEFYVWFSILILCLYPYLSQSISFPLSFSLLPSPSVTPWHALTHTYIHTLLLCLFFCISIFITSSLLSSPLYHTPSGCIISLEHWSRL